MRWGHAPLSRSWDLLGINDDAAVTCAGLPRAPQSLRRRGKARVRRSCHRPFWEACWQSLLRRRSGALHPRMWHRLSQQRSPSPRQPFVRWRTGMPWSCATGSDSSTTGKVTSGDLWPSCASSAKAAQGTSSRQSSDTIHTSQSVLVTCSRLKTLGISAPIDIAIPSNNSLRRPVPCPWRNNHRP